MKRSVGYHLRSALMALGLLLGVAGTLAALSGFVADIARFYS